MRYIEVEKKFELPNPEALKVKIDELGAKPNQPTRHLRLGRRGPAAVPSPAALLPRNLEEAGHRVLLRDHLHTQGHAVLEEAPDEKAAGWCGGRAHEVVVPLTASQPTNWPRLPARPER